ncbi:MAG: phage holin family protein [Vulcanimicrobiaceae bacterium]
MRFLIHFIITAITLYLVVRFVPPGGYAFTTAGILWGALIFGIVNTLIGPLFRLIALPLTILTFGLFSLIVNWGLFALTVWITPGLKTTGVPWSGGLTTFVGSVVIMIVSTVVANISARPAQSA